MSASSQPELVVQWRLALVEQGHAELTCRRYAQAVSAFMAWFEGQNHEPFAVERLTLIDLTGYTRQLRQSSAASTVNVHVAALRSFCGWLTECGLVERDPSTRLKTAVMSEPLAPKALKAVHVNALLREAQQTRHAARDYAIIQLMVQTGIRIGECAALRLGDIQFGERQGWLTVRLGKGSKTRKVPLNTSARQALAEYVGPGWGVEGTMKAVALAWNKRSADEPLWRSQKGGALSSRTISDMFEALVDVCALRERVPSDTTPHTLRHTFATNYLKDHPGDLVGLAALLGHNSLETTRIYVQPTSDDLLERVEATRLNAYQ